MNAVNHDISMLCMGRSRQTLGKGVSNHEIGAQRHKLDNLLSDQIANKTANIT
jgi:hypothetical protein